MPTYEYKVVPVPASLDRRARTAKCRDIAAATLAATINGQTIEGWEYVRTDRMDLPRGGWLSFGRKTTRDMMVFRREPFALKTREEPQVDRVHLKVERAPVAPRRIASVGGEARTAIAAE